MMIDTLEIQEQTEHAMLRDGKMVDIQLAAITVRSICEVLRANTGLTYFQDIDDLMLARLWAPDTNDTFWDNQPLHKKWKINDFLKSPIFPVAEPRADWCVPPQTALAVLCNTVDLGIDEFQLQEPFPSRTALNDTWTELESRLE